MAMLSMKNTIITKKRRLALITLILFAGVCASILMYWVTDQGPGVSPDSTAYIATARSLLAGDGLFVHGKPLTHYPPVYPLLLGIVGFFQHGDILLASRFLAAIFFGVNLVLFGLMVRVCTKQSLSATICAMFLFLFSASAISIHSMAWSEPPYITFSMAAFLLLAHHIARPTVSLLVMASLMVGFAAATRYVGVVLFPTMALALLLMGNRSIKHKMRDIIAFTAVASLPIASWFIRNVMIAQSAANREFAFHPFSLGHVKNMIINIYDFVLPIPISNWMKAFHVGVAAALFLFVILLLHRRMYIKQNATSLGIVLPALCILYFLTYLVFLSISISFFDAHTPVDDRLLFPAFLALTVAAFALAWSLSEQLGQQFVWYFFLSFVLFSVTINADYAIPSAIDIHYNGRGYTSKDWEQSETISYLLESRDVSFKKIYSNAPDAIRFLTGREAVQIPNKESPGTRRLNANYEEELSLILRECREGEALVAYLNKVAAWRWYLPSTQEIESTGNVPVFRKMKDGVIYGTP
jgi:hypothetical protein